MLQGLAQAMSHLRQAVDAVVLLRECTEHLMEVRFPARSDGTSPSPERDAMRQRDQAKVERLSQVEATLRQQLKELADV
jgi:hypothetical protein